MYEVKSPRDLFNKLDSSTKSNGIEISINTDKVESKTAEVELKEVPEDVAEFEAQWRLLSEADTVSSVNDLNFVPNTYYENKVTGEKIVADARKMGYEVQGKSGIGFVIMEPEYLSVVRDD